MFLRLFITVSIFCLSLENADVSPCRKILLALAGCLSAGCTTDLQHPTNSEQAVAQIIPEINRQIAKNGNLRSYSYTLHIHFHGNDLGYEWDKAKNPVVSPHSQESALIFDRHLPLRVGAIEGLSFPDNSRPLFYFFDLRGSRSDLGQITFRFFEPRTAVRALEKYLDNPSETLPKTFLILSAGSHGSSSAEYFNFLLKLKYGKTADLVVLGDAIEQPFAFPKIFFIKWGKFPGVNIYQREDFLGGLPIFGFINIKAKATHPQTAEAASLVFAQLLSKKLIVEQGQFYTNEELQDPEKSFWLRLKDLPELEVEGQKFLKLPEGKNRTLSQFIDHSSDENFEKMFWKMSPLLRSIFFHQSLLGKNQELRQKIFDRALREFKRDQRFEILQFFKPPEFPPSNPPSEPLRAEVKTLLSIRAEVKTSEDRYWKWRRENISFARPGLDFGWVANW